DPPRREYGRGPLDPAAMDPDPLRQLEAWLRDAVDAGMLEPNAMTLATADPAGRVSARMVLLKEIAGGGLEFYSNYASRKGRDLAANPLAAACFWWDALTREVRVEGRVEKLPPETSRAYFATRPYGSQLAAWASHQSRPLSSRAELEERFEAMRARFREGEVPLPPTWGGYRLLPVSVEFWQGRENRLHDRVVYRSREGGWEAERLYP
ncbi:MAG: pyridoxamine 5'-phosphate oxidase, partial [Deinococcales bacterium]